MNTEKCCAVILAAGHGKRMKSKTPKVLCEVLFKPMVDWVIDSASSAVSEICVVVGHGKEIVREHLRGRHETVEQTELLGTGHAVMQATDFIARFKGGNVLILCGDAPLMDSETILQALKHHNSSSNSATVISANLENPFGYGRIVRDDNDTLKGIAEEKDADDKIRMVREVNSGAFWFSSDALLSVLPQLSNNNAQGEYYLTDVLSLMINQSLNVGAYTAENPNIVQGANNRVQLHTLNQLARKSILENLMLEGVEVVCDDGVIVGPDVKIGTDSCLLPGTIITGKTVIGSNCNIGPCVRISDCNVFDNVSLSFCERRNEDIK